MLNTFVVYVENKPGVLTRVASLFRRRAFNIDSLTVGRTEKPEVSRMTIVVDADHDQALRVEANLYKLVNVLFVENITGKSVDLPRPGDDQGRGHARLAVPRARTRQRISRARGGCRPGIADDRNYRPGSQDRRLAGSAASLRDPGNGADRRRGHAPRRENGFCQSSCSAGG